MLDSIRFLHQLSRLAKIMLSVILIKYFGAPRWTAKDGLLPVVNLMMVNFCSGSRRISDMPSFYLATGWSFREEWRSMLAIWYMETNGIG